LGIFHGLLHLIRQKYRVDPFDVLHLNRLSLYDLRLEQLGPGKVLAYPDVPGEHRQKKYTVINADGGVLQEFVTGL